LAESPDLISLRDAATRVYEALKKPPHIWTILSDRHGHGDAESILESMAGLVAGKIPLYGRQPPKSKIERLDVNDQTQVKFENGARTMRHLLFQMPPCTDLQVRRDDMAALIESQRGLYAPREGAPAFSRSPSDPPLEYQRSALQQVILHLRRSGVRVIHLPQFRRVIADVSLRDGINPIFEPLSLESAWPAIEEFMREGKISLHDDGIAISSSPA
jgi:hypothetical protein